MRFVPMNIVNRPLFTIDNRISHISYHSLMIAWNDFSWLFNHEVFLITNKLFLAVLKGNLF